MKIINCKIQTADIRYYFDFSRSVLEIIFVNELGTGRIELPPHDTFIFEIIEKDFLADFKDCYFRMEIDENGRFKRILHIIDNDLFFDYKGNII
jgi:hypothetical protein